MIVLPDGFTRDDLLKCVDREIRLRERVYPRWVEQARMTAGHAQGELSGMRAVRAVLAQLPAPEPVQRSLPLTASSRERVRE
jgi:hypothetical protein